MTTSATGRIERAVWGTSVALFTTDPDGSRRRGRPARRAGGDRRGVQPVPPRLGDLRRARAAGRGVVVGPLLAEAITVALRAARADGRPRGPDGRPGRPRAGLRPRLRRGRPRRRPTRGAARCRRPGGGECGGTRAARGARADRRRARTSAPRRRRWPPTGSPSVPPLRGLRGARQPGRGHRARRRAPPGGWRIAIGDDHIEALVEPDSTVTVVSGALATSGTTVRAWRRGGRTVHHIVDPRTGDVAAPCWRTASVAAATCVDANTASTAAIVMGAARPRSGSAVPPAGATRRPRRHRHDDRGLGRAVTELMGQTSGSPAAGPASSARCCSRRRRCSARSTPGGSRARGGPASRCTRCTATCRCSRSRSWPCTSPRRSSTPTRGSRGSTSSCRSSPRTSPFWLGLGAVALDLVLAVVVTSLLRLRIGLRQWRAVHLSAYALWPVALLHGVGIGGADTRLGWVLALYLACAVAVLVAVVRRLLVRDPDRDARRRRVDVVSATAGETRSDSGGRRDHDALPDASAGRVGRHRDDSRPRRAPPPLRSPSARRIRRPGRPRAADRPRRALRPAGTRRWGLPDRAQARGRRGRTRATDGRGERLRGRPGRRQGPGAHGAGTAPGDRRHPARGARRRRHRSGAVRPRGQQRDPRAGRRAARARGDAHRDPGSSRCRAATSPARRPRWSAFLDRGDARPRGRSHARRNGVSAAVRRSSTTSRPSPIWHSSPGTATPGSARPEPTTRRAPRSSPSAARSTTPGCTRSSSAPPIGTILQAAGDPFVPVQAVLLGGLGGAWLGPEAVTMPLSHAGCRTAGAAARHRSGDRAARSGLRDRRDRPGRCASSPTSPRASAGRACSGCPPSPTTWTELAMLPDRAGRVARPASRPRLGVDPRPRRLRPSRRRRPAGGVGAARVRRRRGGPRRGGAVQLRRHASWMPVPGVGDEAVRAAGGGADHLPRSRDLRRDCCPS